jgi:hypothetical protein
MNIVISASMITDGAERSLQAFDRFARAAAELVSAGISVSLSMIDTSSSDEAPAEDLLVTVHEIARDGIPDLKDETLTGRVGFIFDGCVVSGWPLHTDPENYDTPYSGFWEADSDVGHTRKFAGVTHWLEFPVPVWQIGMP